ncbi:hypothetical protein [Stutzerimonas stutzeri]|nr:hypothetical protein [Stutzerimonas stutzeri]
MITFLTRHAQGHTVSVVLDELGLSSCSRLLGSAPACLEASGAIR